MTRLKCEIPYEVCIYVVKQSIWNKYYNKLEKLRTYIVSKEKTSSAKKDSIYQRVKSYCNCQKDIPENYKLRDEDIKELVIRNKNFELGVNHSASMIFDKEGLVPISITCDEIQKHINYQLEVYVSIDNFFEILGYSEDYITNGSFHGHYYFDNYKISGTNPYKSSFILDDKTDINEDVEKGRLLSKEKKTTTYKPGHRYLLKNRDEVIYLGSLYEYKKNINSYYNAYSIFYKNFITRVNDFETVYTPKLKKDLIINLTTLSDRCYGYIVNGTDVSSFIKMGEGQNLDTFIPGLLEYIITCPESDYVIQEILESCFTILNSKSGGVDLGEFVRVDPDIEITDIINDYCLNNYEKYHMLISGIKFKSGNLDSDVKEEVMKYQKETIKGMIRNIFSRSYSITTGDMDKMKTKTGSELVKYLSTNFSSSYYIYPLNNLIKNKVIDLTEDEIISIVTEARDAYLKEIKG